MSNEAETHEVTEEEREAQGRRIAQVINGGEWFPPVPVEAHMQIAKGSGGILWSDGLDRMWHDAYGSKWKPKCEDGAVVSLTATDTGEVVPWNEPLPPLSSEATVDEAADAAAASLAEVVNGAITADPDESVKVAPLVPAACDGIPLTEWFAPTAFGCKPPPPPPPARVGVYKTKVNYMPDEHGDCDMVNGYCHWNGETWGPWSTIPAFAEEMAGQVDNTEVLAWRGLTAEHPEHEV